MIYHIKNQEIIAASTENLSGVKMELGPDVIDVIREEPLYNFLDYIYVDGEFISKEFAEFSLPKTEIIVDELTVITIPSGVYLNISGPHFSFGGIIEDGIVEFSAERPGLYRFEVFDKRFKYTQFNIEVIS